MNKSRGDETCNQLRRMGGRCGGHVRNRFAGWLLLSVLIFFFYFFFSISLQKRTSTKWTASLMDIADMIRSSAGVFPMFISGDEWQRHVHSRFSRLSISNNNSGKEMTASILCHYSSHCSSQHPFPPPPLIFKWNSLIFYISWWRMQQI